MQYSLWHLPSLRSICLLHYNAQGTICSLFSFHGDEEVNMARQRCNREHCQEWLCNLRGKKELGTRGRFLWTAPPLRGSWRCSRRGDGTCAGPCLSALRPRKTAGSRTTAGSPSETLGCQRKEAPFSWANGSDFRFGQNVWRPVCPGEMMYRLRDLLRPTASWHSVSSRGYSCGDACPPPPSPCLLHPRPA